MKPNKKRVPVWLLVVGMLVTLVLGGGIGYFARANADAANGTAGLPTEFKQVASTYNEIEKTYYKKVSPKRLADGAIKGMVNSLGDQFSEYLVSDNKANLDNQISASFGGIGATIQQNKDTLTIESILADTPAKKARLKVGDQLTAVNGKSVVGQDVSTAVSKIRGKIGTKVTVTVKRAGRSMNFTMKRAKITTATVTGALDKADKKIGVITMTSFSEPTAKQFKQVVKKLRKQGAKSFVLDLRGNPGGELDQALRIASMCLKNGQTIVKVQDRNGNTQSYKAGKKYDDGFKVKEPMAILIDGNSASASEILSAALNEDRKVPLVGEQSYGKGTVQTVSDLSKNAEVKLTIAKWLTPNGNWINKKGLTPTKKVSYPAYADIQAFSVSSLKLGDENANVKSLQQILSALGYNPGTANGYYGPSTQTAIRSFQSKNKLTANGTANTATLQALVTQLSANFANDDPQLNAAETLLK